MLTKNEICTLINIFIADPTQADLFCGFCITQGFVAFKAVQAKENSYHNQHPTNHLLLLAIEVFGCLNKQADVFLHGCANAMWDFKRPKGPPFFLLVTFLHKKISITLQKIQASSILNHSIAIGLTTSQLSPLQDNPPITMANLLQTVDY